MVPVCVFLCLSVLGLSVSVFVRLCLSCVCLCSVCMCGRVLGTRMHLKKDTPLCFTWRPAVITACQEHVNALTAGINETFRQSSSSTVASPVDRLENRRYSGYLLYWYKSTNTDAEGSAASGHIINPLREHGFPMHEQSKLHNVQQCCTVRCFLLIFFESYGNKCSQNLFLSCVSGRIKL